MAKVVDDFVAAVGADPKVNFTRGGKYPVNNKELKETIENLHGTFANVLLIVAGAHAMAAIVMHFMLRDGVLRRMLPGGSSK